MTEFPRSEYDLAHVKAAGELIATTMQWKPDTENAAREAFHIPNNWRETQACPMRSLRGSLRWYMHAYDIEGVSVARLKRMQAIRRKLARSPIKLHKLQDLGGCRAILATLSDAQKLVSLSRKCRHEIRSESDYITQPKADGYRCHHLMFNYVGRGERRIYTGKRIEVQIRTRLQHSWATAVESVGLFRGEYLKGSMGSEKWLRLFKLMSAEFALFEDCPEPPS